MTKSNGKDPSLNALKETVDIIKESVAAARAETLAEPIAPVVLPPTPEERQQAFLAGLEALSKQHGCTVVAQMTPRVHGDIVQVEAQLVVALIPDWKAS